MSDPFDCHLAELFACRACPSVAGHPVTGAVRGAKVILVGQAPGPRENDSGKPFAYTAGTRLFAWFEEALGVGEETFRERVHIGAVARCFPGRTPDGRADRAPSKVEIAACSRHLDREIEILAPRLIIAVGTLAARELVGTSTLARVVGSVHRVERVGRKFDVVVLPHPSGRSTWFNAKANRALLQRSLELIAAHEAIRSTFRSRGR